MIRVPGVQSLGYTVVDGTTQWIRDTITHLPPGVLVMTGLLLIVLFVVGLAKKMFVFTVVVVVLTGAFVGLWLYSGHVITVG